MNYPTELEKLIDNLSEIPTIGKRSAERICFYILNCSNEKKQQILNNMQFALNEIQRCEFCRNFIDKERSFCSVCLDENRSDDILCIIPYPEYLGAIENADAHVGKYYILFDELSFKSRDQVIDISDLVTKIKSKNIREIIIATDPTIEGTLTADFLIKKIRQFYKAKISKLPVGIPVGGKISYMDELTIKKAFKNRGE